MPLIVNGRGKTKHSGISKLFLQVFIEPRILQRHYVDECPICDTCSEVKLNSYYGAKACRSCIAFFSRTHKAVTRSNSADLSAMIGACKNRNPPGQLCSMHPGFAFAKCRYCRYQRCLLAGLKPKIQKPTE